MICELKENMLHLSGEITVKTVNLAMLKQLEKNCQNVQKIDFSGVTRADSACLSLLLHCLRQKNAPAIEALPASIQVLADLYEVHEWIKS